MELTPFDRVQIQIFFKKADFFRAREFMIPDAVSKPKYFFRNLLRGIT